ATFSHRYNALMNAEQIRYGVPEPIDGQHDAFEHSVESAVRLRRPANHWSGCALAERFERISREETDGRWREDISPMKGGRGVGRRGQADGARSGNEQRRRQHAVIRSQKEATLRLYR